MISIILKLLEKWSSVLLSHKQYSWIVKIYIQQSKWNIEILFSWTWNILRRTQVKYHEVEYNFLWIHLNEKVLNKQGK